MRHVGLAKGMHSWDARRPCNDCSRFDTCAHFELACRAFLSWLSSGHEVPQDVPREPRPDIFDAIFPGAEIPEKYHNPRTAADWKELHGIERKYTPRLSKKDFV